jgi:hypothetical protein
VRLVNDRHCVLLPRKLENYPSIYYNIWKEIKNESLRSNGRQSNLRGRVVESLRGSKYRKELSLVRVNNIYWY